MVLPVGALLARRAALQGSRPAVIAADGIATYAELDARVSRTAAALAACGVAHGDRVAVAERNGAAYLALYFACARLGAILVGVNWRLAAPEIAHVLADSQPRLVLFGADFAATAGACARARGLRAASLGAVAVEGIRRFEEMIERAPAPIAAGPIDAGAPLAICYTSGTTGRPKGAVLTHAQLAAAADTIGDTVDYRLHDVSLVATPLFHVGGLSFATLFAARGACVVLPAGWVPEAILADIARHRIDHFFAVPAMLDALAAAPGFGATDLSSVRWIMTGAAPLPERLIGPYRARGIPLLQSYGATETAGPACCVDADHAATKALAIGKPFFRTEVRVIAADGTPAPDDAIGELQVRGEHVFSGYWNDPQASAEAFTADGWLATGDVGYRDAEGFHHLVDRKKEVIISGGENIYPAEVERVLADHPAIAELGVVGIPDARWGEAVCVVALLRPGHTLALAELHEHCRGRIATFKLPARLVLSDAPLARNATGKLVKQALRERAARG